MDRGSIEEVMQRMDVFLDDFDGVAREAHKTYRSYNVAHLLEHSRRAQAACIYDHMVHEALRRFEGKEGIRLLEVRGLKLWLFEDHTVVRFKKMDEDGKSRNYPTRQARAYDYMAPLEGLPPEPTRVTVGYVLDKTETDLGRVQIARPNANGVDWCAVIIPSETRAPGASKWEEISRQLRVA